MRCNTVLSGVATQCLSIFFFLMIRRPPRSTPLSLHDALPIYPDPTPPTMLTRASAHCRSVKSTPAWRGSESSMNLARSEEHTSELQSRQYLVCRLLLEKKKRCRSGLCTLAFKYTCLCVSHSYF